MAAVTDAISAARTRREGFRTSAGLALKSAFPAAGAGLLAAATDGRYSDLLGYREMRRAKSQYEAAGRDHSYTAIRPIAVKIADLPIRVGRRDHDPKREGVQPSRFRTKGARQAAELAPDSLRKHFYEGLEPLPDHPLLNALQNPNPYMTTWALMYCTTFSIQATGNALWWLAPEGDELRFWYIPATWFRPVHAKNRPFVAWKVLPPGSTEEFTIPADQAVWFAIPDPENPTQPFSPLQSQSRAVNTDEQIQRAQLASMQNGINPGMVLVAGRLDPPPGQTGQGPRPVLTPEQRKQLVSAIQLAYRGVHHFGEPIIVDGMIEDVYPYTRSPEELAFPDGSRLTKDRIMQGIGTNPIIAGQIEGANRASSYVAQENFYANVVNPLGTLMSQVLTKQVAPKFGGDLVVWIEKAKARDADLQNARMQAAITSGSLTRGEIRRWAATGEFDPEDRDDDDELVGGPEAEDPRQSDAPSPAPQPDKPAPSPRAAARRQQRRTSRRKK